ncbi:hypothetical protein JX266_014576, partial [Neoarthrinium moseri]
VVKHGSRRRLDDFVVSDSGNDLRDGHDGIDDTPSDTAERIPQGDLNSEQDIGPDALASLSKAFGKLQDALVLLKTTINSLEAERKR